ncbi:hypothetical protein ACTQ5K_00245 [Niallia sp. Sow4_A1]|uniref:Uncharacterized protein n=1 Tax=Niallia hominis TaxID=3133173 RepID=A0ABV1F686_9BACI|nr:MULTISPECIES: hypothetical protein [Niallia]MCF2647706.1 hypothetical protein [Niallia circulans]MCM3361019.1 hypothetical protein [Niallia sp. MER TA 168]
MRQENNDELIIKRARIVKEQIDSIETGHIGRGLFFGMLISTPLWISFFGWLRIFLFLLEK